MSARKKVIKKASKKTAQPRRRKLVPPEIPEGWWALSTTDEIAPGDAYWDNKQQAWITLTVAKAPVPWQGANHYTVIRRYRTPLRASAETPAAAAVIQAKMRSAMTFGEDVELAPRQEQIISSGQLGPRGSAGGVVLTATAIQAGELAAYIASNPIFDKRHLSHVPEGTDQLTETLFKHHLARIPETDRAQLYAQGGMEAVRDMAMRLARQALRRRRSTPAKKRKTRKS